MDLKHSEYLANVVHMTKYRFEHWKDLNNVTETYWINWSDLGKPSLKKVTKLRTFSVPPLAPPPPRIYGHLWGSFF